MNNATIFYYTCIAAYVLLCFIHPSYDGWTVLAFTPNKNGRFVGGQGQASFTPFQIIIEDSSRRRRSRPLLFVGVSEKTLERNTDPLLTKTKASNKNKKKKKSVIGDGLTKNNNSNKNADVVKRRVRRKYTRKRTIPETERRLFEAKKQWREEYEKIMNSAAVEGEKCPSIWSFESLFPEPVLDEASIRQDLYGVRERDAKTALERNSKDKKGATTNGEEPLKESDFIGSAKMKSSLYGGPAMMRLWRERRLGSSYLPGTSLPVNKKDSDQRPVSGQPKQQNISSSEANGALDSILAAATAALDKDSALVVDDKKNRVNNTNTTATTKVDQDLTRLVEYIMYGYRRTRNGEYQYETSLAGDGAVRFRDGVRLSKPLRVNADRLTYHAKKELQHGRVEEAQDLYEQALVIDPEDGRAYLGLSRCAERRRDFALAREFLRAGIARSSTIVGMDGLEDRGSNPFLLQALGCLEEKMGHLAEAEALYLSATKSRPWHAAAWVALAQLRTRKLGHSMEAGRALFQAAERELQQAGQKRSSHVYTAWAALEYNMAGDIRRARELYNAAIDVDPKCSVAHLQLGVLEADNGNWDAAEKWFDSVLKFDKRNSRVLQAYAIMETRRPGGNSQKAIDLFKRALKANPRDGGVLQAYGLYVETQGNIDLARELLSRATEVDKRHAAAWQAWGVLEMNQGNPEQARGIFQQGIWACAQLGGCQSGGYRCARLWQAWGLLEAKEGDQAAARRCFSRALDADNRNIPTITAWALMEEESGNIANARSVFERSLKKFAAGSETKTALWRRYELMEKRQGNLQEAQRVYQRSMRETLAKADVDYVSISNSTGAKQRSPQQKGERKKSVSDPSSSRSSEEVEIVRWDGDYSSSLRGEVWMNDRVEESRDPSTLNGVEKKKRSNDPER